MREMVRVCMPRYLQVGKGSITKLPDILATIGDIRKPLIVTDKVMVALGHVAGVVSNLASHGMTCGAFDATASDPTDNDIKEGLTMLEAGEHDCLIGLGGGSPIDVAKAVAVMSQHSRDILDYRPPVEFNSPGLPMIAAPTTAGTGAEVTHHAVIVHSKTREKISCRGEAFVPYASIVDYELTLSKPKRLSADNALDTLTHGIEAYVSAKRTLFSNHLALDCMRLVGRYIEYVYANDGSSSADMLQAREGLMLAATFGGLAFSNSSICLVHAMSRPLGSIFHVPHGMGNAMLLPTVTAFSLDSAKDWYIDCSRAIGFASENDSPDSAAQKFIDGLYSYSKVLKVPSMSEFGINQGQYENHLEQMADDAIRSGAPNNNPRVPTKEEIIELYLKAW